MKRLCFALIALAASSAACANAPAPYVFLGAAQLFIGNALLGWGEGWLLARVFKVPRRPAIASMVAANYFSAWVGFYSPSIEDFSPSLYDAALYLWLGTAGFFLLTVILEWPFVWLALKGLDGRLRKSVAGSLLAQAASYALLIPLYWAGSYTTLLTEVQLARDVPARTRAIVYYVASDGRRVMQLPLGGVESTVATIAPPGKDDILRLERSSDGSAMDLWFGKTLVAKEIAKPPEPRGESGYEKCPAEGSGWFCVVDLRAPKSSDWQMRSYYGRGVGASNGSERVTLGLETPFLQLSFRAITVLSEDQIVFEVKNGSIPGWRNKGWEIAPRRHQICLLDPKARRLSVIADGRQPVVVTSPIAR